MANYPTSDPSFAAKNTGDTIQASHVNALQDEVVAIGAALRGTLQHAVTVGTGGLTVSTGNTVLGQNLSVAGASTLAGSVVLSSLVTAPAQPRCFVYSTAAVSLAQDVFTALSFEQEQFDVGGLHSTASNPSRITIPAGSSGLYLCGATVHWSTGGAPNAMSVRIIKNSTTEVSAGPSTPRSSVTARSVSFSAPMVLDGTDFLEVEVFSAGSTGSISAASVRRSAADFWAVRLW